MDYHSKISVMLDVGGPGNAALAMGMFGRMEAGFDPIAPTSDDQADKPVAEIEDYLGFDVEDQGDEGLWIHADENAELRNVVTFVLACAGRFDLRGYWSVEMCHDASKPVTDAYGGAYTVLDLTGRREIACGGTSDSIQRVITAHGALSGTEASTAWVRAAADAAMAALPEAKRATMSDEDVADARLRVAMAFAGLVTVPSTGDATAYAGP